MTTDRRFVLQIYSKARNFGPELYRMRLPVYEVVHGPPDTPAGWSVRLPAYEGAGLTAEILNRDGRVVFT